MNQYKNEETVGKKRILVAPLDWGLGHATRCIPIINELKKQNCDVWLAGEGAQKQLLTQEFPDLPFLDLPGYRVKYARTKRGFFWKMLLQSHKLSLSIRFENNWLKKAINDYRFDAVISDNRYGLYHTSVPAIFITHQLKIKSPVGKWSEGIVQKRNYRYINRFTECWVPDINDENSLGGELSNPVIKPATPVHYIGFLSRFIPDNNFVEKKNNLLVILSGPEPQRTILEEKIIKEISQYNGTATIVRGLPLSPTHIPYTNMIKVYNHLGSEALKTSIQEAELIICRSGYSSVMDLMVMQKKCIFIPTPGQTEQEYLGRYLMEKKKGINITQHEFTLNKALEKAQSFNFQLPELKSKATLAKRIEDFLLSLR